MIYCRILGKAILRLFLLIQRENETGLDWIHCLHFHQTVAEQSSPQMILGVKK